MNWKKKKKKKGKPNTATQSRRTLKKKSLRSKIFFSKSSKCRLFLSRHMHHIKQQGTTIQIALCHPNFPCQQLHHCLQHLWHNPINAKQGKHHRPQIRSKGEKDKEVVYWFPISFTHTTPIQNQNLLFSKIINSHNIPQSCNPKKKKQL